MMKKVFLLILYIFLFYAGNINANEKREININFCKSGEDNTTYYATFEVEKQQNKCKVKDSFIESSEFFRSNKFCAAFGFNSESDNLKYPYFDLDFYFSNESDYIDELRKQLSGSGNNVFLWNSGKYNINYAIINIEDFDYKCDYLNYYDSQNLILYRFVPIWFNENNNIYSKLKTLYSSKKISNYLASTRLDYLSNTFFTNSKKYNEQLKLNLATYQEEERKKQIFIAKQKEKEQKRKAEILKEQKRIAKLREDPNEALININNETSFSKKDNKYDDFLNHLRGSSMSVFYNEYVGKIFFNKSIYQLTEYGEESFDNHVYAKYFSKHGDYYEFFVKKNKDFQTEYGAFKGTWSSINNWLVKVKIDRGLYKYSNGDSAEEELNNWSYYFQLYEWKDFKLFATGEKRDFFYNGAEIIGHSIEYDKAKFQLESLDTLFDFVQSYSESNVSSFELKDVVKNFEKSNEQLRIVKIKKEEENKRIAEAKKKEEEAKKAQDNILKPISKPEF